MFVYSSNYGDTEMLQLCNTCSTGLHATSESDIFESAPSHHLHTDIRKHKVAFNQTFKNAYNLYRKIIQSLTSKNTY